MGRYFFGNNAPHKIDRIKRTFKRKYNIDNIDNLTKLTIKDLNNNQVILKDDVELSITFISGDKDIQEIIRNRISIESKAKNTLNESEIKSLIDLI